MTMMGDGVKHFEKEDSVKVMDLAELIDASMEQEKASGVKE